MAEQCECRVEGGGFSKEGVLDMTIPYIVYCGTHVRAEAMQGALEAIIIRCAEGDKRSDWLPTIASIARAALA